MTHRNWFKRYRVVCMGLLAMASFALSQEGPSSLPLVRALQRGDLDVAHQILRSGVDLNIRDNYGTTALLQAIRSRSTDFAVELLSAGADANFAGGGGDTPLMVAAWHNDLRVARSLLDLKASVNTANQRGETALMFAAQTCLDGKMVQFLLDAGGDPQAKSKDGFTALIWAAGGGNEIATEKLLRAGSDLHVKNSYGETAEDLACGRGERGHARVCELLREASKKN